MHLPPLLGYNIYFLEFLSLSEAVLSLVGFFVVYFLGYRVRTTRGVESLPRSFISLSPSILHGVRVQEILVEIMNGP